MHKIQHGTDDFNVVIENIKKVVLMRGSAKPIIGVQFVVNQNNYKEISVAGKLYKEIGVDYITFKPAYKNILNKAHEENTLNLSDAIKELREVKKNESDKFKVYVKESQFIESIAFETNNGRYYSNGRTLYWW
jgi:MoaA/NifB/PqqE/SkfB family radical SAM enzyme